MTKLYNISNLDNTSNINKVQKRAREKEINNKVQKQKRAKEETKTAAQNAVEVIQRQLDKLHRQIKSVGKKIIRDLDFLKTNYGVSLNNVDIRVNSLLVEATVSDDLDRLNQIQQNLFRLDNIVASEIVRCIRAAKQEAAKQQAAKQEAAKQEAAKQEAAKQEAVKKEVESIINGSEEFGIFSNANRFQVDSILGKGKFGTVFKVTNGIQNFAIKIGKIFPHELEVMSLIGDNYPNLVGAKTTFSLSDSRIAIIMDVHGEELFDLLLSVQYSKRERYIILTDLARGLHELHKLGYAHMDIKAENVLLVHKQSYAIIDFGMSTRAKSSYIQCGSAAYIAPEVKEATIDKQYNPFIADIWSLGVLFYATLIIKFPYDNNCSEIPIDKQITNNLTSIRDIYGLEMSDLLSKMLTVNPNERLTIKEVCEELEKL